jgi:hypothetical protein
MRKLGLALMVGGVAAACGEDSPSLEDYYPDLPAPGGAQTVFAGSITAANPELLLRGPAAQGQIGDYFMRNERGRQRLQGIGQPMAPARQAPPQRPSHAPRVCSLGTVCVQLGGTSCGVAVVTDSNAPRSVLWRTDVALTSAGSDRLQRAAVGALADRRRPDERLAR